MSVPAIDLLRVAPEIVLTVFGSLIVLADPFLPRRSKDLLGHIAFIGVLLALSAFFLTSGLPEDAPRTASTICWSWTRSPGSPGF